MTTQFSCGHWDTDSEDIGIPVALKRQDVDEDGWKNVIHYATYCANCRYRAWYDGGLLMTEEEEMNWLNGNGLTHQLLFDIVHES